MTPLTGCEVVQIEDDAVTIAPRSGGRERLPARTVIWAAGVVASSLAGQLATASGLEVDHAGRVPVGPDLTLPGYPEVFALGDMVQVRDADGAAVAIPGVAPVAIQQGRFAARAIRARLRGRPPGSFRYREKGNLATIGRASAIADIKGVQLSGFVAWLAWLVVHLFYLIGFQNRFMVVSRWIVSFVTRGRGARLITGGTGRQEEARPEPTTTEVRPLRADLRRRTPHWHPCQ